MSMKKNLFKRSLSALMAVLMVLSCWVWFEPAQMMADAAASTLKDHYLFAYFTGTSKEGQTIHLAVSKDGYNYTALRNNEPVIIPSKGVGNVRDPYIWYNEQDNYYYILATDLDFTDGGGTYSNNSQSFIIWRSKDLVNWYDETFIDVSKMAHLIGDTRNMSAVWAPQVLWDGSAYVVYFTLACNATSWFDIVYLKTTDLMDPNAYYEFDYILGNSTGNGVCDRYGVIDADIIHNPGDGLYYLFYKTECNANELGTTNKGTSLKTIHYYVGDTPTGPFRNPGDTKWTDCGFSVFPNYDVSLEGCNSFFDNDGNLIMYADEFEHTNYYTGKEEAYFHIAKSNGYDFTSWSYPDVNSHNINSLSPRHGSVVKITEAEYNRLLNNSYNITSSSYSDTEVLEDHLVAKYFTTADVKWNDVYGQPNLASATGITMVDDPSIGYYAQFDSTNGGWADVDFDSLFRKTNGLNYEDGFTITFSAMLQPNESVNNENNDRIYEIADVFGSRTGTEHYTHFSPGGGGNGSYLGNYNGPVDSGNDWLNDKDRANRDDQCFHDYIISYATGNVMVYVDGELVISRNRFTGVKLDNSWYKALGSNATMRIGKSGWDADPLFKGRIQNLCIYDCSMSYYDAQSMNDDYKEENGWVEKKEYSGITSAVPTFSASDASQMEPLRDTNFSNVLYSQHLEGNPWGSGETANPTHGDYINSAATYHSVNNVHFGIYYSKLTVLLIDGINPALIPVEVAGRINHKDRESYLSSVYPSNGGSESDNLEFKLQAPWVGWNSDTNYHETIKNPDGSDHRIGHNQSTSFTSAWLDDQNSQSRKIQYYASTLRVDEANLDFGGSYYKKYDLIWRMKGYVDSPGAFSVPLATKNNPIYLIDFRPIITLRNQITESAYNEVMNNPDLCPELKQKYASAVYTIRTLDPNNFGFAASPVTATKALGKAIGEAVNTYNGVMDEIAREEAAGTYGHQPSEFEARDAKCDVAGLTAGSYCVICGEILEEQEVIAPLAHTFGAIFTENGVQYKQCSVCGVKIEYQASEVRYENLFSFNRWENSTSKNVFSGTISTNSVNGTITIVNQNTTEMYTRATYDGQNLVATRDFGCYCIPVDGGKSYVVEATSLASSTSGGDVFVFQYNKDGLAYQAIPAVIGGLGAGQTRYAAFTVDANAAYIELRFDANDAGKSITFSNIGVYTEDSYKKFASDTADARLGFYPGESKDLVYPNPGDGYTFDGWYTYGGMRVDNVYQLNNPSTVVYGKWIADGMDLTYDSIFSFSDWAKSSCNQLWYGDSKDANGNVTRLVSDEGIVADAENGTITIYNDEDTSKFARTNYWANNGNVYKSTLQQNTEYILEYTVTSEDGGKPSVCLYITGGTPQYPETGNFTRYSTGTHYYRFDSGNNTALTLRFDNVQHGSTVTFSDIAVYKADFEEAARTIENREYRRYYPVKMGFGNMFEYTPVRPGFTFDTWMADLDGDGIHDSYDCRQLDDTALVEQNWHVYSTWTENSYTITYNANGGSGSVANQTQKYTADVTLAPSGFTKAGYVLAGWSTVANATSPMYQLGQTVNRLNGDPNGTTTLYAVWSKDKINVTFDNLIDFKAWNKVAGNGVVSNVTDTGFTITCNDGAGEATSSSPFFAVEPGKQYKVEMDVTGKDWDVYFFFCNEAGAWVDFADGSNRYSSNGSGNPTQIFTAPNKSEVVKAQIRVDSNGSGNVVTFNNIRVYEYNGTDVYVSPVNKVVTTGDALGTLPTPTRSGYDFAGWFDANGKQYTASSAMDVTSTLYLNSKWTINNTALMSDAYVLDFGMKAVFTPLENDTILKNDGASYSISGVSTDGSTSASTVKGTYGTFTVNGNSIEYVPTTTMNGTDVAYYHVNVGGKILVGTMFVFPATVVYYEDDVQDAVEYIDGKASQGNTGKWSETGSSKLDSATQNLSGAVYGFDDVYKNSTDNLSMNSAHIVSVSKYNNPQAKYNGVAKDAGSWPVAEFTFAGTGFDLVSLISKETGSVEVVVRDSEGNKVYDWIVDTYYGYKYENEEWVVDADADTSLYQIPVISNNELAYGTYTVQIIPTYTTRLDHQKDGAYDFYLDAIRVYNPMGEDYNAATMYFNDGEYVVAHQSIRDILINAGSFGDAENTGAVYINPTLNGDFEDYKLAGPKNEVYLSNDQAVAFNMTVSGFKPTSVQISAHAVNGTAGMKVVSGSSYSNTFSMTHKTTLYYSVPFTAADYWVDNGNGTYTLKNPIVISNTGDGLLSLCNIKVATNEMASVEPLMFMMSDEDFDTAVNSAAIASTLSADDGALFVPDDMASATESDVVATGEDVLVTINTSAEVHTLTVNGENATLVSVNEDGSKTWNYTFTTESRGEKTFTLVAYNADGFASEETTVTVDVQSRIEIFFNKLTYFFNMIVEILDNIFGN